MLNINSLLMASEDPLEELLVNRAKLSIRSIEESLPLIGIPPLLEARMEVLDVLAPP